MNEEDIVLITHNDKQNTNPLQKSKSYNTRYSQVVPHPSTRRANTRLTSEIGRDPVKLACMVVAENELL